MFYTDQERDASTGLYNYDARLYDPVIGLFMSADTIVPGSGFDPQMLNRFSYVRNNPLRYVDTSGHSLGDYQSGPGDYGLDDNPGNWNSSNSDHYSNKELERNSWKEEISKNGRVWTVKKTIWDENGYQRSFRVNHIVWDEFDRTHAWEALKDHVEGMTFERAGVGATDLFHNAGILYLSNRTEVSHFLSNTAYYSGIFATGCYVSGNMPGFTVYTGIGIGASALNSFLYSNTPLKDSIKMGAQALDPTPPPGNLVSGEVIDNVVDTVVGDY